MCILTGARTIKEMTQAMQINKQALADGLFNQGEAADRVGRWGIRIGRSRYRNY